MQWENCDPKEFMNLELLKTAVSLLIILVSPPGKAGKKSNANSPTSENNSSSDSGLGLSAFLQERLFPLSIPPLKWNVSPSEISFLIGSSLEEPAYQQSTAMGISKDPTLRIPPVFKLLQVFLTVLKKEFQPLPVTPGKTLRASYL